MPRTCTICTHRNREDIDKLLLRGEALKTVAMRFSVSDDALGRHKKHMRTVMTKAAAAVVEPTDVGYGSALLAEVGRIRADVERLQLECENRRDTRGALRAIEVRLSVIELAARFTGQIDVKQKVELRVHFTADRARAVAETYLARHNLKESLPPASLDQPHISGASSIDSEECH